MEMKTLLIILITLVLIGCKPEPEVIHLPSGSKIFLPTTAAGWEAALEYDGSAFIFPSSSHFTITKCSIDCITHSSDSIAPAVITPSSIKWYRNMYKPNDTINRDTDYVRLPPYTYYYPIPKDLSGDGNIMIGWPIPEEMGGGVIQSRYINDSTIIHTNRSNGKIMVADKYGKLRKEKL